MAIPVIYNLRSVRARWVSSIVAVLGIAGTVGVFVAMLSLANGFRATLVASGSQDNAILMRAGATAEMMSGITLESIKIVQDDPGVARDASGPLITSEVVVVAPFPLRATGTNANVQVRGVSGNVLTIRRNVKIVAGANVSAGTFRTCCRLERQQNLFRTDGWQYRGLRRRPLARGGRF